MWNNFIISLAVLAQLTGLSLPQILEEDLYLIPSYTEQNIFHWQGGQRDFLPEIGDKNLGPIKISEDLGLDNLEARAALIQDKKSGKILWQKNAQAKLSIASLTKLMTVLVFLENQPKDKLEHLHTMSAQENGLIGARLHVDAGDKVKTFDLLRATLVGSTNNGAMALAHSTEMSEEQFVEKMNQKAEEMGLTNTVYADPTGLDDQNQSTAADLMRLFKEALGYAELAEPMGMREHLMETAEQNKLVRIKNTNPLLKDETAPVIAGKTGYLEEAGFCLIVEAVNEEGNEILVVVLGEASETTRSAEVKDLINWTFANYEWR